MLFVLYQSGQKMSKTTKKALVFFLVNPSFKGSEHGKTFSFFLALPATTT